MKRRPIRRWMMGCVLLAVIVCLPAACMAQEGQDEAGAAFAGGQMVRGTVTAVLADHLTVKPENGEVFQVVMSVNTRLTKDRQPLKAAEVKPGDGVVAMGVMDSSSRTLHAVFIGVVDAAQVKKAREGLGKIYITGKVTAIDMDALKLTILRPDGVSQVIGVDEGTSFKRGGRVMAEVLNGNGDQAVPVGRGGAGNGSGESITLADIKAGDSVAGRGAMKKGVFVPTELGVVEAAKAEQKRPRGTGAAPQ